MSLYEIATAALRAGHPPLDDVTAQLRGELTDRQRRQIDALLLAAGEPIGADGTVDRAHAVAEAVVARLMVQGGA